MMVARLIQLETSVGLDDLFSRLNTLKGLLLSPTAPVSLPDPPAVSPVQAAPAPAPRPEVKEPIDAFSVPAEVEATPKMTGDNFMEFWKKVVAAVKDKKRTIGVFLEEGVIAEINHQEIVLQFDQARKFHAEHIKKDKVLVEREIKEITGQPLQIKCVVQPAPVGTPRETVESPQAKIIKDDPMTKKIMEIFNGEIIQ
jgi:hypothetical protein